MKNRYFECYFNMEKPTLEDNPSGKLPYDLELILNPIKKPNYIPVLPKKNTKTITSDYINATLCRTLGRTVECPFGLQHIYFYILHLPSMYGKLTKVTLRGDIILRPLALVRLSSILLFMIHKIIVNMFKHTADCAIQKISDAHFSLMAVQSLDIQPILHHEYLKDILEVDVSPNDYDDKEFIRSSINKGHKLFDMKVTNVRIKRFINDYMKDIRVVTSTQIKCSYESKEHLAKIFLQLATVIVHDTLMNPKLADENIILTDDNIKEQQELLFNNLSIYDELEKYVQSNVNLVKKELVELKWVR